VPPATRAEPSVPAPAACPAPPPASLRHPNIVAVFGAVLPDIGDDLADSGPHASAGVAAPRLPARPRACSASPRALPCRPLPLPARKTLHPYPSGLAAAALFDRHGAPHGGPVIRPPALVCEYLAHGSLRSAINAAAEWLAAPQAKVKLMLDTARVGCLGQGAGGRRVAARSHRGGWGRNGCAVQALVKLLSLVCCGVRIRTPCLFTPPPAGPRLPALQEDRPL
jgi:hypothetical protein